MLQQNLVEEQKQEQPLQEESNRIVDGNRIYNIAEGSQSENSRIDYSNVMLVKHRASQLEGSQASRGGSCSVSCSDQRFESSSNVSRHSQVSSGQCSHVQQDPNRESING